MSMLQDELDKLRNTVLKASYALSTFVIPLTALLVLELRTYRSYPEQKYVKVLPLLKFFSYVLPKELYKNGTLR